MSPIVERLWATLTDGMRPRVLRALPWVVGGLVAAVALGAAIGTVIGGLILAGIM